MTLTLKKESIPKDILEKLYFQEFLSLREIGKKFGRSGVVISYWMDKYDLDRRGSHEVYRKTLDIPKETIVELYVNKKMTCREVAELLSINPTSVSRLLQRYDLSPRRISEYPLLTEKKNKRFSGAENPMWRGGTTFLPYPFEFNLKYRGLIRDRDKDCCVLCGKTKIQNKRKMAIHHIDRNKQNNSPDNLVSLCSVCHGKAHSGNNLISILVKHTKEATLKWF